MVPEFVEVEVMALDEFDQECEEVVVKEKWEAEIERILRERWPVDGPFVTTLNELGAEVRSDFGMPNEWLNLLIMCIGSGVQEIIDRQDREELTRLAVRMYLSGLLQGAKWQRQGKPSGKENHTDA